MKLKQNSGFSLVEVMVAAALMGAVALGIAKLTKDQTKSTKTIETRFEFNAILSEIRQTLSDKESCTASFLNRNAVNTPPGTITKIVQETSTGVLIDKFLSDLSNQGPTYGNGAVRITSYSLTTTDADPSIGIPPGESEGTINLVVVFYFGKDRTFGTPTVQKKLRLSVKTISPTDFRITECVTASGGSVDGFVKITGDTMTGDLIMADGAGIEMQSDARLKHDIHELKKSRHSIHDLRPVTFKWNANNRFAYGFIAQEVEEKFPTIVKQDEDGIYRIDYFQLTPLMVRSIQELEQENQKLKAELTDLKKEQSHMKKMMKEILKKR